MAVAALGLIILVPVSILCALASATLVISSYSVLLPILATSYGLQPLTTLYICFAVDFVNGAFLSTRYRKSVTNPTVLHIALAVGACCACIAVLVSQIYGIQFIEHHKELSKAVGVGNFLLGVMFLIKAYQFRQQEIAQDRDGNGSTGVDAEIALLEQNRMGEKQQEISVYSWRMAVVISAMLVISCLSGVLGFGGGQIVAIVWMVLFNLQLLPSIAIGSLISSCLMGGMLLSYTFSHDILWDDGLPYFAVILPSDAIAVYFASIYAETLSEKWLALLISGLSFAIGAVTTAVVLSA